MGGGKETPRQKMIGLMYLVLMAMLAMNVSKEIINAFVTLNNKLESSIEQTEAANSELTGFFESAFTTLKAQGAPPAELARVEMHKNTNDTIVEFTRKMANDIVKRNLFILISALDPNTTFEEIDGIDKAILSEDAEAKSRLNALITKVNAMGLMKEEEHGDEHGGGHDDGHEDPYENVLFHIDDDGYIHIKDLGGYMKKDDYDTPTRLMAGPDFEHIAEEGKHFMENIQNYRNKLCSLIADHPSDTMEDGSVYQYKFDTSAFHNPKFLNSESDRNRFKAEVDSTLDAMVKEKKIAEADKHAIRDVYVRMTIPEKVMNHGKEYPWIFGQFDHAPIVAASAVMTSVRSDVLQVQNLASTHIKSRVKVQNFNFNKIDPLAFSSTSYINQGDSLGLKVMIAAYDSSEAMELRYWEDDTSQYKKPDSEMDKSNMKVFKGKAGDQMMLSGSVGDHLISGLIAVKEKGIKKWKPWQFRYAVGAPNAAISAADLQVLYINWKNKIRVSASGYKPESVSVRATGGCRVSGPDSKGFYTATVTNVRAKTAKLIVSAVDDNGKSVELANEEFRIFPLPKPTASFAGKTGGNLGKGNATSYSTIKANLGDSPLNVPYKVVGFKMFITKNGQPIEITSKSNRLTNEMKQSIKKIPKGGSLTFTAIDVINETNGKKLRLETGIVLKLI